MRSLLSSPRRRKRLAWSAVLVVVAAGFVLAAMQLPGGKNLPPERFSNEQVIDVRAKEQLVKVTRADRAAINATLDHFVPAAVARKRPVDAFEV